nr:hypothetical protein [uncultured Acetatifactor sp.]
MTEIKNEQQLFQTQKSIPWKKNLSMANFSAPKYKLQPLQF